MIKCPFCNKEFHYRDAKIRSIAENSYYWGVVIPLISNDSGYTKDEVHDLLKSMFLKNIKHIKLPNGKVKEVITIKSTAELTTVEFEEFLTEVRTWASLEIDCYIPLPNEENYEYKN